MVSLLTIISITIIYGAIFQKGEEIIRVWDQIVTEFKMNRAIQNVLPVPKSKQLDVPLINQMAAPRLYNGCEVTSLAMILQYHGIVVSKNELAENVPTVPLTYKNGLKGNPNEGFVGDMENGPGLSVYHKPIFQLAKQYVGKRVQDLTGSEPEVIYEQIRKDLPVWVIVTNTFQPVHNFQTWETPQGKIDITFSVHSVVVTGYDDNSVYVNNPYGVKNQKVSKASFEEAWIQIGRQAVVITK
nr:C39 family peptidase [Bacillus sp. FJAT-47783]